MHQVFVSRDIPVPSHKVWEVINDFGQVYAYHPLVESSPITNGVMSGLGSERVCHFHDGNSIKERITRHDDGKNYTVEIIDVGKFPLKKAVAKVGIQPVNENLTTAYFQMDFLPKFGPLGWLMAKMMMKNQFVKILNKVLKGLEDHVQTGKVINKKSQVITT